MASLSHPLCFVGYMAGSRPGFTTSQGFVLSQILRRFGWSVKTVSARHNRWMRLADTVQYLVSNAGQCSLIVQEVYGGRNFILVDVASMVAKRSGRPILMVLHGGSLPELIKKYPAWTRRVLGRASALIAPSAYLAREVSEAHGFRVEVIPNVVDVTGYPYRQRTDIQPRLFWMRAFRDLYNPGMAVRVLEKVRTRYPGARLIMAGKDFGELGRTQELVRTRGLEACVSFPGFLSFDAKIQAAEQSDIFLNTSRIDNMPVAIVEAWAMGLPVISTRVGGVPDLVIDGENGLLTGNDNDAEMAEAVFRLIEEPSLARQLSMSGKARAESSSCEAVIPRWEDVFRKTISLPHL